MAEVVLASCFLASAVLLAYDRGARRRECQLMERLRGGALYMRLHSQMSLLGGHDIDQVRVEPSGVTVTSVIPAHTILSFDFKQNGNEKRNACFTKLTAQLLSEDFPFLRARERYRLTRYRIYRVNGRLEYGYLYTMRRKYKDLLIASRGELGLWIR